MQVLIELTDLRKKIVQSFRSITLISSATLHEGPTDKEEVAAGSEREAGSLFLMETCKLATQFFRI